MSTTQDLHTRYEPHPDAHSLTADRDPSSNITSGVDYEPHPEQSKPITASHDAIIKHITALYSGSASETDKAVYAEKSIYDDPFSYCDTRYKIAGQWYGIPKLFYSSTTLATEVVSDADDEIVFKLRQEYVLRGVHSATKVVDCLVSLKLDETGKVRYHKDMWNEKDYSHEGLGKLFKQLNGDQLTKITLPPESL